MNSRILLITPKFYGIEKEIQISLVKMKYEVVWIENKILPLDYHARRSKFRILRRLYFLLFSPQKRFLKKEFKKIDNLRFDVLLSINGHILCPYLFKKIKSKNNSLFSILYLWDASSEISWIKEQKYFDKVITFDKQDSDLQNLEYKPNFFLQRNDNLVFEKKYDLFFIGKFSLSRLSIIDHIIIQTKVTGIEFYVKLWPSYKILMHSRLIYKLLKNLWFYNYWINVYLSNYEAIEGLSDREYIIHNYINYSDVQRDFFSSNVILDLEVSEQSGYSHRLIEALANGKKVITTNVNVTKEPFFNKDQIHLISSQNPQVDQNWIKKQESFPISSFFSELELENWLKSVLNVQVA